MRGSPDASKAAPRPPVPNRPTAQNELWGLGCPYVTHRSPLIIFPQSRYPTQPPPNLTHQRLALSLSDPTVKKMPCVDCPALGDIAAIIGLATLVAAAAAWLTGNWRVSRDRALRGLWLVAVGDGSQRSMRNRRLLGNHRGCRQCHDTGRMRRQDRARHHDAMVRLRSA
jgi:hypothetical protein